MKRLAIYGHIPKFTIRELIIYDQHRLFVTTPQGTGLLPELCLFLRHAVLMLSGCKTNIESCN
jgi:hypothetical protein